MLSVILAMFTIILLSVLKMNYMYLVPLFSSSVICVPERMEITAFCSYKETMKSLFLRLLIYFVKR